MLIGHREKSGNYWGSKSSKIRIDQMTNHRYSTPDKGSTDWHIPLNDNFSRLDTDVEIRDSESSLDSYEPKNGAKFVATDTQRVYFGDGNQWNRVGSITSNHYEDLADNDLIVYVSSETGRQTVDPNNSSTPVEDAIDEIASNNTGGAVFLPPKTISHDGPINAASGVDIIGFGGNGRYSSAIEFTHGGDGIRLGNRDSFLSHTRFGGFMIRSPSQDFMGQPSPAVRFMAGTNNSDPASNVWDHIAVRWWYGPAFKMDDGANAFEQQFRHVRISLCDAGDSSALIDFSGGGAPNEWGTLAAYPSDAVSGQDSIIYKGGTNESFGMVNIGGQAAEAFDTSGILSLQHMNWEPKQQNSRPDAIFKLKSFSPVWIGSWGNFAGDTNHIYQLEQAGTPGVDQSNNDHVGLGNKFLPMFLMQDYFGGSISGNIVEVKDDVTNKRYDDGPVIFQGVSKDVNNASGGSLTQPITCLGDLTRVS